MQLVTMRDELHRELSSQRTQRVFDQAKQGNDELRQHPTVFSVLAALQSQVAIGYEAQDRLLRVLVARAQAHPEERLWRKILLYAFLPGLIGIRQRAIGSGHESEELDTLAWTAFFEVVHAYSLHRPGSIAAGLLLDTRKRYLRALTLKQELRKHERALLDYARGVSAADEPFALAEHMEPAPFTVEPDDREDIRLACSAALASSPRTWSSSWPSTWMAGPFLSTCGSRGWRPVTRGRMRANEAVGAPSPAGAGASPSLFRKKLIGPLSCSGRRAAFSF